MISEKDNRFAERWAKKLALWQTIGGRCVSCGNSDVRVAAFHHVSGDKEIAVSRLKDFKWSVMLQEAKKCVCYCVNCHFEYHTEKDSKEQIKKQKVFDWFNKIGCERCGYRGKNTGSLHFHHIKNKNFYISRGVHLGFSMIDLEKEIANCELICANCHCLEHIDTPRFSKLFSLIESKAKEVPNRIIKEKTDSAKVRKLFKKYSRKEISAKLNISEATICQILNANKITPSAEEQTIIDAVKNGISHRQAAKQFNCSRGKIRHILRTRCR